MRSVFIFAAATLAPVPLLVGAGLWGSWWALAACAYLTLFTFLLDELIGYAAENAPRGVEFPAAGWLSITLGLLHFPLFALAISAVAGATGLDIWERIVALFAFGIFMGQVSYSNAHELIHKSARFPFWLGAAVYSTTLYGHHVTAHRHIHHRYVGSDKDPNTARLGESFYRFAARAWGQALVQGLHVETKLQRAKYGRVRPLRHVFTVYGLIGALTVGASIWVFDVPGLLAFAAVSLYASAQILLADYVQHYGLARKELPNGKLEPIGLRHSWNAPHPVSAAFMLNAPRHSDHHAHPSKPFTALALPDEDEAPMLPTSLPAMSTLALFPPFWRKVMDDRAKAWDDDLSDYAVAAE